MRLASRVLAGLFATGLALGALAQDKKPKDADLGKKRSVAPDAALAGSLEQKAKKPAEQGPTLEFETFRYQIEVQVSGKRREEIDDLQKLIQLGGSSPEMPSWLFRLGELYWEEARYAFFESNRRDDEIIRLGPSAPAGEVARIRAAKKDLENRSKAYQARAVEQYKEIYRRFPKYSRLHEVLFFLGENLWKQGQQKEALAAYKVLITRFPTSRFVPDAWMAFGEYYFNNAERANRNENLGRALGSYQKAATYTESSVYGYALYKQAWVYYNLGKWKEALDLFRAVIFFGDLPTTTIASDKRLALVKEARKDYVRTYSHVGAPEGAMDEFKRVGGDSWWEMLKGLAGLYYDEGQDREAILVYHQLIKQKPLSAEAPYFQSRIVTCGGRMGKKEFAVKQAREFVRMLKEIEDSKSVQDEAGKKLLADARQNAENTLRTLAVQYHNEYRKTRDEPIAPLAAEVYHDYLTVFPNAPQAYEMRFFHAELLFSLEQYQRAGDEYTRVVDVDVARLERKEKPGKYLSDSLENAVFSYDSVAKKFEETEKRTPADAKQRLAIPKPKQQLLDACLRYMKYAPKGPKYVEIAYKAAKEIYYRYNRFAEATDIFTRIALDHPKHELAAYSTNLVLDAYNLLGDQRNVNGWAKRFWKNEELIRAHPELKDDLGRIIEQSSFKVIEEYEKSRSYGEAAEAYLAFVRDWPGSRLAATALYNASVDLVKVRQLERAFQVREQLISRYPNDPLAAKCVYSNGVDYEGIADFEKAAEHYERYFDAWRRSRGGAAAVTPKSRRGRRVQAPAPAPAGPNQFEEQKARDALYDAGVLREGLKQWGRAEADRLAYVATWPSAKETPKVFLSVADIYSKQKSYHKELRHLEEYQKQYAREPDEWLVVQGRMAKLYEKLGNRSMARRVYEQAVQYYHTKRSRVTERGMAAVAWGMYYELEPEYERYDRIRFDVAPKYLKGQLDLKKKRLREIQEKYAAVVKLKHAESAICSLYRMGLASNRFAETLLQAPIPKELKALRRQDVIDEFRAQLQQLVAPIEQDALQGMDLAAKAARDYSVSNDCSRQAIALLRKSRPEQYGQPLELLPAMEVGARTTARTGGHEMLQALLPPPLPPQRAGQALALPPLQDPRRSAPPPSDPDMTKDDEARPAPAPAHAEPLPVRSDKDEDEDLLK